MTTCPVPRVIREFPRVSTILAALKAIQTRGGGIRKKNRREFSGGLFLIFCRESASYPRVSASFRELPYYHSFNAAYSHDHRIGGHE